jgi:hypothetical protein
VSNAFETPRLDLECLKSLYAYQNINSDRSDIELKKLSNHLWYLSLNNFPLAFYDDKLVLETNKIMVQV